LQESHNQSIAIESKRFDTMEDFIVWKSEFEKSSSSSYVLHSAPQKREDHSCYYYYCNRSGVYHSKGKGKRALKLQGSNKVDGCCVAYMRARKYISGVVIVEVCDYHLHESQLAHIPLPESTRHTIAAKLQDGVEIQAILDSIRDGVQGTAIGRSELVNRQDIHNIRHQYNIEGIQYHTNDHSSVQLWVDSLQSSVSDASIQPQLRFFSTKKKQDKKPRLAKPGADEIAKCLETLDEVEIDVCGICFRENDRTYGSIVDWIQCCECDMWFHCSCVAADSENTDNIYICFTCSNQV
jgi:hypothetical protein